MDVFRAELQRLIAADAEFDEIFRTVQEQQTEFTPLPKDWGLLDLVRQGKRTAACPYAPQSCALLEQRPEINSHCFSERVPNAGVAFARLLPGAEIKPHFATEPRLAVHLGLVTPPGPEMWVANETVTWSEGRAVVFDDTFFHGVRHRGVESRYILLAWTCHPCDLEWRVSSGESDGNLPPHCMEQAMLQEKMRTAVQDCSRGRWQLVIREFLEPTVFLPSLCVVRALPHGA